MGEGSSEEGEAGWHGGGGSGGALGRESGPMAQMFLEQPTLCWMPSGPPPPKISFL